MTLNRWKLVAGVLGLGMCGLAALAEPACRNTAAVNARMPEEKKPEVPVPGRKPNLELPSLPPPPVVNASTTTESLPLPGSTKVDFPAVGGLPIPTETTQPLISKLPDLPPEFKQPELPPLPTEKPPVTVPFSEAKNLPLPKAVEPLPSKVTELPSPILPPLILNDPVKVAEAMNGKFTEPLPKPDPKQHDVPAPKEESKTEYKYFNDAPQPKIVKRTETDHKLETGKIVISPPPRLNVEFVPPPIMAVADTQPVPTKPLTAAIDPAPVAPPQLTPRIVSEETTTPLRPVSVEKKLRVQLNLGSGKPWLEIRDNEELVLKVVAEAVEVKAVGEGTEGLNVLKATGGVSFRTLGGNGTCDELRVVPGTGEVQLSGKVVVTSNWGKAETTATSEKMTFRLGAEPTGKK